MKTLKRLVVTAAASVAALALGAGSAGAVSSVGVFTSVGPSFTDYITITISKPSDLISSVIDFAPLGSVGTQVIKVLDGSTMVDMSMGGGGFVYSTEFYNKLMDPGTYTIEDIVTGAKGTNIVTLSAVSAAVPEPATWLTMLVGFGGLGVSMRNRRKQALTA